MQTADDEDRLFLVQLHLLPGDGEGGVEPGLKGVAGLEDGGEEVGIMSIEIAFYCGCDLNKFKR